MFNLNEFNISEENTQEEPKIIPLVFLASVEHVTICGDNYLFEEGLTEEAKILAKETKFDVRFSVTQDVITKLYNIAFTIRPVGTEIFQTIVNDFEDYKSKEAHDFTKFAFDMFLPFKKAVLKLENREYTISELSNEIDVWMKTLDNN